MIMTCAFEMLQFFFSRLTFVLNNARVESTGNYKYCLTGGRYNICKTRIAIQDDQNDDRGM